MSAVSSGAVPRQNTEDELFLNTNEVFASAPASPLAEDFAMPKAFDAEESSEAANRILARCNALDNHWNRGRLGDQSSVGFGVPTCEDGAAPHPETTQPAEKPSVYSPHLLLEKFQEPMRSSLRMALEQNAKVANESRRSSFSNSIHGGEQSPCQIGNTSALTVEHSGIFAPRGLDNELENLRHASREKLRLALDEAIGQDSPGLSRTVVRTVVQMHDTMTSLIRQELAKSAREQIALIHRERLDADTTYQNWTESVIQQKNELKRYADRAMETAHRELMDKISSLRQELDAIMSEKAIRSIPVIHANVLELTKRVCHLEKVSISMPSNEDTDADVRCSTHRSSWSDMAKENDNSSTLISPSRPVQGNEKATSTTVEELSAIRQDILGLSTTVAQCATSSSKAAVAAAGAMQKAEADLIRNDLATLRFELAEIKGRKERHINLEDEWDILHNWCEALHKDQGKLSATCNRLEKEFIALAENGSGSNRTSFDQVPGSADSSLRCESICRELCAEGAQLMSKLEESWARHEFDAEHKQLTEKRGSLVADAADSTNSPTDFIAAMDELREEVRNEVGRCERLIREDISGLEENQETVLAELRGEIKKEVKRKIEKCRGEVAEVRNELEEHEEQITTRIKKRCEKITSKSEEIVGCLRQEVQGLESMQAAQIAELRDIVKSLQEENPVTFR